ncbi:ParA family protein [Desulfoluna butyratoxydans]|uniref:Aaa domain n=1 Tax=Desulfoluna butyratoxydans TaxID=231438 RepID=A0A4U8YIH2_9BACT|nr:AAA family ATPase [Desulfoluna butyratoxydans]VFQ43475.1 aaa domain [Desulfoluna butyratoxydans]
MNTICIANQKGGVGKTTTAINIAAGLAKAGKRVLLIDLDPQGNLTQASGVFASGCAYRIEHVLHREVAITDAIVKDVLDSEGRVDLVPADETLKRAEDLLVPELFSETRLAKALEGLSYDHVVLDCSPSLGLLTVNALVAATHVLIPCDYGSFSIGGIANIVEKIKEIGLSSKVVRLFVTMYRSSTTRTNEWAEDQLAHYKEITLETKIRRSEPLLQASIERESIFKYAPGAIGADDYTRLTEEFLAL